MRAAALARRMGLPDPRRRAALYDGLTGLGCQVWMTGADAALFGDLPAGAQRFAVTPGRIDPLA